MFESPTIRWVLHNLHTEDIAEEIDNGSKIDEVSVLTQKASSFYEKLRYVIDYKEEHSIRRSAIERILKRRIILEGGTEFEHSFLRELAGVGYVSKSGVSEKTVSKVRATIEKYLVLQSDKVKISTLVNLMATEVEGLLYPKKEEELIVEAFYSNVIQQLQYDGQVKEDELKIQTYIACRRSLIEEDNETLLLSVAMKYLPELPSLTKETAGNYAHKLAEIMPFAKADIEENFNWKIYSKIKNQTIFFLVIKELVKKHGSYAEVIFNDPARLEEEIRSFLKEKFKEQRETLNKSGGRAVVYVLVTKVALALALELPFEKFFHDAVDYYALATNLVFHPVLLLIMVKGARLPGEKDEEIIVQGVKDVLFNKLAPLTISSAEKTLTMRVVFYGLYGMLFLVSFGGIIWVLDKFHFSVISMVLFVFFLTIVSYFGFRLRYNTRKWKVYTKDDSVLALLWHFLTIPIVRTGRWLSSKFSSVNLFILFFDFILEVPFKLVLGTFDDFIGFLKDKRDDPY